MATTQAIYKKMFLEHMTEYSQMPLAELCSKIGSGATPKGGKSSYCESGVSLIRSTNVFDYSFEYSDLAHITDEQAVALSNAVVQKNDVLFNITGVSVTRCCIVPDDVLPARVNQHVMILRPHKENYMSFFLMATLCHPKNKAKLLGIGQSGSTREAINKQEIESFSIIVPPNDEIDAFGKKVEILYKKIYNNMQESKRLEAIQHLLLSQLSSR